MRNLIFSLLLLIGMGGSVNVMFAQDGEEGDEEFRTIIIMSPQLYDQLHAMLAEEEKVMMIDDVAMNNAEVIRVAAMMPERKIFPDSNNQHWHVPYAINAKGERLRGRVQRLHRLPRNSC